MELTQIINIVGLVFDIVGVVCLFFARDKGLKPLSTIRIRVSSTFSATSQRDEIRKEIEELISEVNSIINRTNSNNKTIYKKSIKWIILIVVGFTMQLISIVLPK